MRTRIDPHSGHVTIASSAAWRIACRSVPASTMLQPSQVPRRSSAAPELRTAARSYRASSAGGDGRRHGGAIARRLVVGGGRLRDDPLALGAEPRALVVVLRDERLLLGHGGVGLLEPIHEVELGILQVALAPGEGGELALEALHFLGVARRGQPLGVSGATRVDHLDVRLDACELAAEIVSGAEARGELW